MDYNGELDEYKLWPLDLEDYKSRQKKLRLFYCIFPSWNVKKNLLSGLPRKDETSETKLDRMCSVRTQRRWRHIYSWKIKDFFSKILLWTFILKKYVRDDELKEAKEEVLKTLEVKFTRENKAHWSSCINF